MPRQLLRFYIAPFFGILMMMPGDSSLQVFSLFSSSGRMLAVFRLSIGLEHFSIEAVYIRCKKIEDQITTRNTHSHVERPF